MDIYIYTCTYIYKTGTDNKLFPIHSITKIIVLLKMTLKYVMFCHIWGIYSNIYDFIYEI